MKRSVLRVLSVLSILITLSPFVLQSGQAMTFSAIYASFGAFFLFKTLQGESKSAWFFPTLFALVTHSVLNIGYLGALLLTR